MDFLQSRVEYLKKLPDISDGWLSNGEGVTGVAPSLIIATEAIGLLEQLSAHGIDLELGNLRLGPIPSGGIGIDIKTNKGLATLQLFNSGTSEIAFEWLDDWCEQELPMYEALSLFKKNLMA